MRYVRATRPYLSLVDLKSQRGQEQDWNAVLVRLAYGMQLSRQHFSNDCAAELHRALTTLTQIHATVLGRADLWYATEREVSILGPALVLTDQMEALCNSKEVLNAYEAAQASMGC